ncbi:MAG: T9SS type A sorting domain-containing protein [Cyclobacteriaceae bacterium]|nr:T9SS type A sorting domain-containing protein [Cyclobacteriaceae bacterium]
MVNFTAHKYLLNGSLTVLLFFGIGYHVAAQAPSVTLPTVSSVTPTGATLGGTVTGTLTHRGTRWSTTTPIGTSNELEEVSTTAETFTQVRSGLPAASRIFFAAYARNGTDVGTTSETTFYTEPSQLTGGQLTVSATGETTIMLGFPSINSWEGSNVTGGYVIFRNAGSAPSLGALADGAAPPSDGTGDKIATITDGAATSFNNTTGLTAETEYYYTIIPFVWDGSTASTYNYNMSSPQTASDFTFSTNPTNHPSNGTFTVTAVSPTQINLAFDAPSGNTDGYIILRRNDASDPTTAGIISGVNPATLAGLLPPGTTLAGTSTGSSFNDTGLAPATRYRYLIIPYNANASEEPGTFNYKTDGTPVTPKNDWTFANEPSGHATGTLTATPVSSSQINLAFNSITTSGITNAAGYILLINTSPIVVGDLAGLADGAAPNSFGLFKATINSTATNTYNDATGLTPNTTYHYALIPFNRVSDDETYNYLTTTGFVTGSATTQPIGLTFTEIPGGTAPVIAGTILGAGTTGQVVAGFSVTSEDSQVITDLLFQYSGADPNVVYTEERLFRSTTAGTLGSQIASDPTPDGNFNWSTDILLADRTIGSSPVYYYLVVYVDDGVTSATTSSTIALNQSHVTVNTGVVNNFSINKIFSFNTSQNSDIILNGGTTLSINYISHRQNNVMSGSPSLATFRIRDGAGSTDGDNKGTTLTDLTIQLTNHTMVRRVALYDGATEISDQVVTGATVDFSGLTLTAPDGGNKDFTVRATFQNTVTDKQQIHVTITSVTAFTSGSGFTASNGGGASSSTAAPTNVIEVVVDRFGITGNPPDTPINTNFPFTVRATDAQGNVDIDYAGQITLSATGGGGTLSSGGGPTLTPFLTAGQVSWTQLRITQSGTYTLTASDEPHDNNHGEVQSTVIITSSSSNITQGTTTPPTICFGNTTAGPLATAFFNLSNIVITETDVAGISGAPGTYTFSIALPTGFVFDQSVISGVSTSGGSDITIPAAPHYSYPASNIVQFSFNLAGTANTNSITISGLKVGRPHPGSDSPAPTGTLNITRLGGSANIAGVGAGAMLGSVGASQQNPAVTFTVATVGGGIPIDPNKTVFNASDPAVNLIGSISPGTFVLDNGVTFVNPDYRFNPSVVGQGTYPVTYVQTNAATGCQSYFSKDFEVITSGIANLNASYCVNDPPSIGLSVDQSYINQIMQNSGAGWQFDSFTYLDPNVGWVPISSPNNTTFDPSLQAYKDAYHVFTSFGYPGFPIGIDVCNPGLGFPCGTAQRFVPTYQWVSLKAAPVVSFTLPSDLYSYCEDNAPVTLTGSPPNSNNIVTDFFTASGGQGASISHSIVLGSEVWVFNPGVVSGVTPSTSQTFNITYQFRDVVTGCSNTFTRPITVHDRPTIVPTGNITKTPPGLPNNTTIQICQGTAMGSFSATDNTYTYRWYSDPPSPATQKGIEPTFNPPVDNTLAGITTFHVTRERNGCESIATPLALSVNVIAAPPPPSPNFSNATRQYCVGGVILPIHLEVPGGGNTVRWYDTFGSLIYTGSTPTPDDLGLNTAAANLYTFNVTQTEPVNGCEGLPTIVTVTIQALPIVSISASLDPMNICTTGPTIRFAAFDQGDFGNPAMNGSWSGAGLAGALNEFPALGEVVLNPTTLLAGNFTLQYSYQNSAGCSNIGTVNLRVLPIITPSIFVGAVCDGSPAIIVNNSTINPTTSTIAQVEWRFGDGSELSAGPAGATIDPQIHSGNTTGTYLNPRHIYPNVGTFQIEGALISSDGCRYTIPQQPVTVSPLPVANFTWQNVCVNSTTNFNGSTNLPDASIQTWEWDFARVGALNPGVGTGKNTSFVYSQPGRDTVRLIVTSVANCTDTVNKPIFIVPKYPAITENNSYNQDFTAGADNWLSGGINSSWAHGTPAASIINTPGETAWVTNLTGNSNPGEKSWVLSRCFDFSSATKPVIALDIWSDTPFGLDGAVLQYSTNGIIEDDFSPFPWNVVGLTGQGINWYDRNGIISKPGNQPVGDLGWTGDALGDRYTGWKHAVYKLDNLIGASNVVFRIAFASVSGAQEGFAFDNVFIGERSRRVLVENFTNTSPAANTTLHNDEFRQFEENSVDIVKLQYHTGFPGTDPVNELNPLMHNARTSFYGISASPTFRVDGDFGVGSPLTWVEPLFNDRALEPSQITIESKQEKTNGEVKINTYIKNTSANASFPAGSHIFTVVAEKIITNSAYLGAPNNPLYFVAKQMLPSPSGITIATTIEPGDSLILPEIIWDSRNLIDETQGAIIIFVQSVQGGNKEVHQARTFLNPPIPDLITAIEDPFFTDKIHVYPNPANHELNVVLPQPAHEPIPISMFDAHGRTVFNGQFQTGEQQKALITTDMAGGLYILQIQTSEGMARKKVMVVHR